MLLGRGEENFESIRTPIQVRLLSQLVVRVAVRINRLIHLLVGHQSMDKLVVCMQQAAQPLFVLDVVNLVHSQL